MNITKRLAYSQLKTNRSRTIFALIAIVLSTALTTAVCSFVASGNATVKDFLGTNYGEYSNTYMVMLLIPAIFFGIIIIAMSIVVISNVFRVSTNERITQFGILKCVGATEKQIKYSVMYESIYLAMIGIPIGLVTGVFFSLIGILVANHFLDDLNDLAHMMVREIQLSIIFVISWKALLSSTLLSCVTIFLSAWSPARKSSKCSAVDCIRGTRVVVATKTNKRINPLLLRIFGYEAALASKNMKRSQKNFRSTITALSIGIILFVCLGSMSNIASQLEQFMTIDITQTVNTEYTSDRTYKINEKTGVEESVYLAPIDSKLGNVIAYELSSYDGKEIYAIGMDLETYHATISSEFVTASMENALEDDAMNTKDGTYTFSVEIITLDDVNYKKLCELANVPLGSNILLNNYNYNNNGYSKDIIPFSEEFKDFTMIKADDTGTQCSIQGVLTLDEIPKELLYFNTNPIRLVVPVAEVRGICWYAAPDDIDGFMDYANEIMTRYFPEPDNAEYMEVGFSTKVFEINDYMKVMNIAVVMITVLLYSFVVLLMLIGFTNVISTISTNIMMRSREFAVLKSIGMTSEGLRKMLNLESILCSTKSLFIGLPVAIMITYLISIPIKAAYPIPYSLPWVSILLCSLGVLAITFGTTRIAVHKLHKQNIIETIRQESGR